MIEGLLQQRGVSVFCCSSQYDYKTYVVDLINKEHIWEQTCLASSDLSWLIIGAQTVHSPREIISTMCKTGQDALRKRKPFRKLFIHISNKSASNKLKNVSMESSKLLCLNGTSFCSKSCKLKTFPLSIASVLTFVVDGPRLQRPQSNLLRFMLKVAFYWKIFIPKDQQIAWLKCGKETRE